MRGREVHMTILGRDTYIRANNASSWGTSSGGDAWSAATNNGTATVSISSNTGVVTGVSTGSSNMQLLSTKTLSDCDLLTKVKLSAVPSASISFSVIARCDGSNTGNFYRALITTDFEIQKAIVGSGTTALATTAFSVSANTFYWVRFRLIGTSLQAMIWQDGNAAPSAWMLSATDSAITTAGRYGLRGFANSGNTNTVALFEVNDPNNLAIINSWGMSSVSPGGIFS